MILGMDMGLINRNRRTALIIDNNYKYREIAGAHYLIYVGDVPGKFEEVLQIQETAAWIWSAIEAEQPVETIIRKMPEEFEIDDAAARKAVEGFLKEMLRRGFLKNTSES